MTKLYKPPTDLSEEPKEEDLRTEKTEEQVMRDLMAQIHQEFRSTKYYAHVIGIINEWIEEMDTIKGFSVETLVSATPEDLKQTMIVSKKCILEAKKLLKKIS